MRRGRLIAPTARLRVGAGPSVAVAMWVAALWLGGAVRVVAAQSGFSLGVAAGDVTDTRAVIWTRADWLCVVRYELATDESFTTIEQSGLVPASAQDDFIVKVGLWDLAPAWEYYYRFAIEGDDRYRSRVGRFRTAPPREQPAVLRFVFSGDTGFSFAPLATLAHVAQEEADFLLWFGDTVYADDPIAPDGIATTLDEYRRKYRQIRSGPHVQEALAALPVWAGWDDHEVTDNYAGADPTLPPEQLAAAYRAFFEYMPIRAQQVDDDPFRTYRRFRWGSQVEFFLLDGRQYREPAAAEACQSNPDPFGTILRLLLADEVCTVALFEERTLLGDEQFEWLTQGLAESPATVKFVVNDVPLSYLGVLPYDRWDGYDAQRQALLEFIDENEIGGVVFLTTDFHSSWYNPDVLRYFRQHRPDYELSGDIYVAEAIVGPLGVATLHESALGLASTLLGRPLGPVLRHTLTGMEQRVVERLQCISGFTLAETNRVSYVIAEVSPTGEVEITYRGVKPADRHDSPPPVETFYTTQVGPPPPLPCCLPVLLVALVGWPALAVAWRARSE